jgi:ankyrin repeat protein
MLLDAGADVNSKTLKEVTPLLTVMRKGHLEIGKLLIRRGADINLGKDGLSPLVAAISKN